MTIYQVSLDYEHKTTKSRDYGPKTFLIEAPTLLAAKEGASKECRFLNALTEHPTDPYDFTIWKVNVSEYKPQVVRRYDEEGRQI